MGVAQVPTSPIAGLPQPNTCPLPAPCIGTVNACVPKNISAPFVPFHMSPPCLMSSMPDRRRFWPTVKLLRRLPVQSGFGSPITRSCGSWRGKPSEAM